MTVIELGDGLKDLIIVSGKNYYNTNNVSYALTRKAQNEAGPGTLVMLTSKYNIGRLAREVVLQAGK